MVQSQDKVSVKMFLFPVLECYISGAIILICLLVVSNAAGLHEQPILIPLESG